MPDLLLELFSEEIPARFQRKAAGDLKKLVTDALVDNGLTYEGAKEYWTPRRLVLDLRGLTARSADIREEKKGPRTDAPKQAIAGFLRGAGLESIEEASIQSDPKKGDFYVAIIEKPGREAKDIIAEIMPAIIGNFPWPKSMRWGKASFEPGSLKWVRPLQSIICTFGPETAAPEIIPFKIDGLVAGNKTRGHRFMAPAEITVKRFDDYAAKLEKAKVIVDAERRKEMILSDAKNLAFAQGYELVEDAGLLEEVANLVEWPVVLMGEFEEEFLEIPAEVVQLTIRENQKCFVLKKQGSTTGAEEATGADAPPSRSGDEVTRVSENSSLTNRFILVSNIIASDGGKEVARGNGKVVNARLSDAKFFWNNDLHQVSDSKSDGFAKWVEALDKVTFHAKLGSQGERVQRIMALAEELAEPVAASYNTGNSGSEERPATARPRSGGKATHVSASELAKLAKRAAYLAKADLQSAMVFEFPEVQGKMGRRYAETAGEDASVALAIEEHYKPIGPTDDVPSNPVSIAVALADKLDTLVGFWAIDEKPTGSKDPYALRRAALGVNRICDENNLNKLQLELIIIWILRRFWPEVDALEIAFDLIKFIIDRLKVQLLDRGISHDVVDAIAEQGIRRENMLPGMGNVRTVSIIVRTATALQKLVDTDDGTNLIQGYKRAANILAAEEKKGTHIADSVSDDLLQSDVERALFETLQDVEKLAGHAIQAENFEEAMSRLASLRAPIDSFFEHVHVNDENEKIRANRLALLARIRAATASVADFSKISG